jgi:hypothetical protein
MSNSSAPVPANETHDQSPAHQPAPIYDPSLPLPPNPFTALTPAQHLGFLSPSAYIAQTVASETANASTQQPLAGHSPAFVAAYTPLALGENLFMLDPVAEGQRMMNIVSGFVGDGSGATGSGVNMQEGNGNGKKKKKKCRRGYRGGS